MYQKGVWKIFWMTVLLFGVAPAGEAQYTIRTLATSGTSVAFSGQAGLAADLLGNVYVPGVVDPLGTNHPAIFKVNAAGATMLAGSPQVNPPYPGCGMSATNVLLTNPSGVAVDTSGNFYISQSGGGPV